MYGKERRGRSLDLNLQAILSDIPNLKIDLIEFVWFRVDEVDLALR